MRPQIWKDTAEMMCMFRVLSSGTGWFHRRATGKGRKIRVSIYESIVRFQLMTFENNVHFYDIYVGPNIFLRCLIVSMIFNRKGGICPLLRNGAMEATEALSVVPVVAILMTLGACILTEFPRKCCTMYRTMVTRQPYWILRMHAVILSDHVHCIFLSLLH